MAIIELLMPKMGESIIEGTIIGWLKKEGDLVDMDESVLEVATDKVDTEVPSTHAGVLKQILAKEGEVIPVGKSIAIIEVRGEQGTIITEELPDETTEINQILAPEYSTIRSSNGESKHESDSDRFYSPLVLNMAKAEGVTKSELDNINGTGKNGRVTKKDMLAFLSGRTAPAKTSTAPITPIVSAPALHDEIIEMDRMRKIIAQRMVQSKAISAHVTSFAEVDVTDIVEWRDKQKVSFQQRTGEKLTFTPILIEVIARCLKEFPMINASVNGDQIILKKDINVGMAVALPTGNLIVPVIKNADQLSITGLVQKVNELARKGRENKLTPSDLESGTYTVSNIGSFGSIMGTPIINQPQVAIMAFGAIRKKPAVVETAYGDLIAIRHLMIISHTYDHRIIDGAMGSSFAKRVKDLLEAFDKNTSI